MVVGKFDNGNTSLSGREVSVHSGEIRNEEGCWEEPQVCRRGAREVPALWSFLLASCRCLTANNKCVSKKLNADSENSLQRAGFWLAS